MEWGNIPDFVSKAGENVARLAGLFHLFGGKTGHIETDNIECAIDIMHWHLVEARRKEAIEMLLELGYLKESRLDNKTTLLVNPHCSNGFIF